jgi:hypothetical protein
MNNFEILGSPDSKPPWYESNMIWGPLSVIVAIALTLVPALMHEFKWLLGIAWLVSLLPIWWLAKRTSEARIVLILGVVLSAALFGAGFMALSRMMPSPSPTTATVAAGSSQPGQSTHPPEPKPEQPPVKSTVPHNPPRSKDLRQGAANRTSPPSAAATQPQPPTTINSAPNGIAISGGTVDHPMVLNQPNVQVLGPLSRHLTPAQKNALGDRSIADACGIDHQTSHQQTVTVYWEPTVEAANFASEFVTALGPVVGLRMPYEADGQSATGLFLESVVGWDRPDECAVKLNQVFNSVGLSHGFKTLPARWNPQPMPYYRNRQLVTPPPNPPPPDEIRIAVGTND